MKNAFFAVKWAIFALILVGYIKVATAEVNYDTAWTFVYDGHPRNGNPSTDIFHDLAVLPSGEIICVGESSDTSYSAQSIIMKLGSNGLPSLKKLLNTLHEDMRYNRQAAHSVVLATNGDLIIGGRRYGAPFLLRTNPDADLKWATWYYDSTNRSNLVPCGNINSVAVTSTGSIICAAGDLYPEKERNCAVFLKFDSSGNYLRHREWDDPVGYEYGGFSIEETETGAYIMAGNQTVEYLDTNGGTIWTKEYTFSLDGVGTVTNNVNKAKMLRNGKVMIAGQAYEGNCWTRYQEFYYDAWWTPISYGYGVPESWDTAGSRKGDDVIYDFAQLVDGNLVFVGKRHNNSSSIGGMWTFVTDSTGKRILWEQQTKIPFMGSDGRGADPYSVSAMPDSGFAVAGVNACPVTSGGYNAFAARFVRRPEIGISESKSSDTANNLHVRCTQLGKLLRFSLYGTSADHVSQLTVTDPAGRRIKQVIGESGFRAPLYWNVGEVPAGVYFYSMRTGGAVVRGTVTVY